MSCHSRRASCHPADSRVPAAAGPRGGASRGQGVTPGEPCSSVCGPLLLDGRCLLRRGRQACLPAPTGQHLHVRDTLRCSGCRLPHLSGTPCHDGGLCTLQALEQASRAVVRYMLFAHSDKPGVPVRRSGEQPSVRARCDAVGAGRCRCCCCCRCSCCLLGHRSTRVHVLSAGECRAWCCRPCAAAAALLCSSDHFGLNCLHATLQRLWRRSRPAFLLFFTAVCSSSRAAAEIAAVITSRFPNLKSKAAVSK